MIVFISFSPKDPILERIELRKEVIPLAVPWKFPKPFEKPDYKISYLFLKSFQRRLLIVNAMTIQRIKKNKGNDSINAIS